MPATPACVVEWRRGMQMMELWDGRSVPRIGIGTWGGWRTALP